MFAKRSALMDASFVYVISLVFSLIGFILIAGVQPAITLSEIVSAVLLFPTWLANFGVEKIWSKSNKFGRLGQNISVFAVVSIAALFIVNAIVGGVGTIVSGANNVDAQQYATKSQVQGVLNMVVLVYFLASLLASILVHLVIVNRLENRAKGTLE